MDTNSKIVNPVGFEPTTYSTSKSRSTPELRVQVLIFYANQLFDSSQPTPLDRRSQAPA